MFPSAKYLLIQRLAIIYAATQLKVRTVGLHPVKMGDRRLNLPGAFRIVIVTRRSTFSIRGTG